LFFINEKKGGKGGEANGVSIEKKVLKIYYTEISCEGEKKRGKKKKKSRQSAQAGGIPDPRSPKERKKANLADLPIIQKGKKGGEKGREERKNGFCFGRNLYFGRRRLAECAKREREEKKKGDIGAG